MQEWLGDLMMSNPSSHKADMLFELQHSPCEIADGKKRYYRDGEVFAEEALETPERLKSIICYDLNNQYCWTEKYWDGILSQRIYPERNSHDNKKTKVEKYYSKNGFCYMTIRNYYDGKAWKVEYVKIFSENDYSVKSIKSLDDLRQFFFSEYVLSCAENNIFVFCDPFLDFEAGFRFMHDERKNIYRIGINHGLGFGGDRKWNSQINPRIKSQIENIHPPEIDAFVVLTKEALQVWQKRLGNCNFLYQLPNTIDFPEHIIDFNKKNLNRVVIISRLDEKQKQISHAIRAFAIATKTNKNLELHIYGRGEDKKAYENLVDELNLKAHVFIEEFTNEVNSTYQNAGFSLSASAWEGFCLSSVEALANGCPVITYNYSCGPKDYIKDGYNGLIVELNNIEDLAKKILYLSQNSQLLREMSCNAPVSVQGYAESNYLANWKKVLNSVVSNHKFNNNIQTMTFSLMECRIYPEKTYLDLLGTVRVTGDIPSCAKDHYRFYLRQYTDDMNDFIIYDVNTNQTSLKTFEISSKLTQLHGKLTICLEWDNTFLEEEIILEQPPTSVTDN